MHIGKTLALGAAMTALVGCGDGGSAVETRDRGDAAAIRPVADLAADTGAAAPEAVEAEAGRPT